MNLRLRDKACETLYLFTKRVRETALIMIQMKGHTDRFDKGACMAHVIGDMGNICLVR